MRRPLERRLGHLPRRPGTALDPVDPHLEPRSIVRFELKMADSSRRLEDLPHEECMFTFALQGRDRARACTVQGVYVPTNNKVVEVYLVLVKVPDTHGRARITVKI